MVSEDGGNRRLVEGGDHVGGGIESAVERRKDGETTSGVESGGHVRGKGGEGGNEGREAGGNGGLGDASRKAAEEMSERDQRG